MQEESDTARKFICKKLGIESVSREVKLKLKRPFYAEKNSDFDIVNNDETDRYWKAEGITRDFLDRLTECINLETGGRVREEGYIQSKDIYVHYLDVKKIQQEFKDSNMQDIFRQFDNLKMLKMIEEISISIKLIKNIDANIAHFSDGQFQSVYIYTIVKLFEDRNCITLLDEPDSFLHPEWQYEFLNQIFEITDSASNKNHVLMSSHSAMTLCSLEEKNINLFKIENSKISCEKRTKKEVVSELSNKFIQYSEDESQLLINNVIRSSAKPILFVEGITDVDILNTAYQKIYETSDVPILIQDAFDHGHIQVLMARGEIFRNHPNKHFFALFDFDQAYHKSWLTFNNCDDEITDIDKGLCKKIKDQKSYIFMLPLLNNGLKNQVLNIDHPIDKIKAKCHFCIEHIFYEVPGLDKWFYRDATTNIVNFKGDKHKVYFAKNIVSNIDKEYFEVFRPMFDLIMSKSKN